jgi:class 3 adenylate cyclase/DNA-binding response OmpR family regulator
MVEGSISLERKYAAMSGEQILIVDDGKENRDFIVEYVLEPNGFVPLVARDGLEGLEMARQYHPDLILLDLQMPRMDGLQVLDALNAEQLDIPVILMTFHGSEEIAVEVYRRGVRDYVKKPYTVEEMYEAIDRSLTEVRLRREKNQLTERLIKANTELNQRVRELNVLYGIGKSVATLMDMTSLLQRMAEAAAELTSSEESGVFLVEDGQVHCKAIYRQADQRIYLMDEIRHDPLAMEAIQTGQVVVRTDEQLASERRSNPSAPTAAMAAPLVLAKHSVGALVVKNLSSGARSFTRNDGALLSALADYAAIALQNATHIARQEDSHIHQTLRRSVVTDVYQQVLADPDALSPRGERRELSIVSAGIDGHLAFVQKAPPEQIVSLLNNYLALAANIIFKHQGTVNQLSGDTISAIFNAPVVQADYIQRTVTTALALQHQVKKINEQRGGGWSFRIGLHVGEAVVGYFGLNRSMVYSAIGEAVVMVEQVQNAAKPGQILVSEAVARHIANVAKLRQAGELPANGMRVYEILGIKTGDS